MAYLKDLKPSIEIWEIPKEYQRYIQLFVGQDDTKLPVYTKWDHKIPLKPDIKLFYQKIYRFNEQQLETLRQYLQQNLKRNYIWELQSSIRHSILFVSKKTGSDRLCIDYQTFNENTIKDRYLLFLIIETRGCFRDKKWIWNWIWRKDITKSAL